MSLQDYLMPGEKVLSVCEPFYATSRRIMRYDEKEGGGPAEIAYQQLTGVELIRKPSHPMIILGLLCIFVAILLTMTGLIIVTSIVALFGGGALIALGVRGGLGYYQLRTRSSRRPEGHPLETGMAASILALMESLGLRKPDEDAIWRLDYQKAGSFIATVRNITGELPGL